MFCFDFGFEVLNSEVKAFHSSLELSILSVFLLSDVSVVLVLAVLSFLVFCLNSGESLCNCVFDEKYELLLSAIIKKVSMYLYQRVE